MCTSLPACLGCSVLETLCKQKTAPKNKRLMRGIAAHPSIHLQPKQGKEREAVRELGARCPGDLVSAAFGCSPWHPAQVLLSGGLSCSLRGLVPQKPAPSICRCSETSLGTFWQTKDEGENVTQCLWCCGRTGLSGASQDPSMSQGLQPSSQASVRQGRTNLG